jgi:hypothetical protein
MITTRIVREEVSQPAPAPPPATPRANTAVTVEYPAYDLPRRTAICLSTTVAVAVLTFFVARRHRVDTPARWLWTALALPLGVLAPVLMLALRHWPALVLCPSCAQRCRADQRLCPTCGTPANPPLPNDTEVLIR